MQRPEPTRILLTGAAGLVGEAVARALLAGGQRVIAPWCGQRPFGEHPALAWVACDLTDARAVARLDCCHAVAHVAAVLPAALDDSSASAAANRTMDAHILAYCIERRVPLVYASSVAVYDGEAAAAGEPLDESTPLGPVGDYAREKAWAEHEGARQLRAAGATFTSLRLCAPYGPRQWRGSVIQRFIEQALAGEPLLYHGTGTREQSFTHVSDIARAFDLALTAARASGRDSAEAGGGVFNVTATVPVTMRDLALLVARQAGLDAAAVRPSGEPDPLEGARARYDVRAAAHALGWRPEVSLADGVAECLRVQPARRARCR